MRMGLKIDGESFSRCVGFLLVLQTDVFQQTSLNNFTEENLHTASNESGAGKKTYSISSNVSPG